MRVPRDRADLLAAAAWWSVPTLVSLIALAFLAVLDHWSGWWTAAGLVILWLFQAAIAVCAMALHWAPRLRGRLDIAHDALRGAGLSSLVGLCVGSGLYWLQAQLLDGSEAPLWTALLWGASLPVTVSAILDRGSLRKRYAAAPPPTSDVERRAFRVGHRRVGATGRRGRRFTERPRAQESRAEAIDG